jgi:hypothetical protein
MKTVIILLCVLTQGCEMCREHPVYCAVGGAILVGSAVAIAEQHSDHRAPAPVALNCHETFQCETR